MMGCQEPRISVEPDRTATLGALAERLSSAYYLDLDPWQRLVLGSWLGTAGGEWSCKRGGLLVPRQNGKNAVLDARELFGALVLGERILHTAHQQKTARKSFAGLVDAIRATDLAGRVTGTRWAIGREGISFANGGSIDYMSRSRGGARGFTVDLVVVDEAQEMTDEHLEAIMPALAAAPRGNPQMLFVGTPPGPNAPGEVFGRMRDAALAGGGDGLSWHEWSVDEPGDVSDRARWAACNPAYGARLKESAVAAECAAMSPDGFARERLGWWPASTVSAAIPWGKWDACSVRDPKPGGVVSYGVKFSSSHPMVSLAACARHDGGASHVELVRYEPVSGGVSWLADWLADRAESAAQIVLDGQQGAPMLAQALAERGAHKGLVRVAQARDAIAASSALLNAIEEEGLTHIAQAPVDDAVRHARKRRIGSWGGWGFGTDGEADASPVEALALALWASMTAKRVPGEGYSVL